MPEAPSPEDQAVLPRIPVAAPDVAPAATPGPGLLTQVVVGGAIVAALYFGREVLIPITLAVLLSFVLSPLMELLRRIWLGRVLSALLSVVLALAIILALGTAIGAQIAGLAHNAPKYQATVEHKIESIRKLVTGEISALSNSLSRQFAPPAAKHPAEPAPAGEATAHGETAKPPPQRQHAAAPQTHVSAFQIGERYVFPVLSPIATFGIILVVTIFILLQKEDLRDRLIRLFGSSDLHRTTLTMNDAGRRLSRYFLTQLGINTSFGVIVGVGLSIIGVPSPLLWGILGALLRFVPYIGSYIAAALPLALAAAVAPGWSMAVWTAILYIGTELIMGQAVEPMIYGHSTGLSPLAVIVAAIFWTWIWGPIGLILSTPLTLCLVVLGRHVKQLEFLDVLLGDRPALTPVESFYQRMLAGDPDEAEEHAERFLKDHSLSEYYDDVALKGLQLAAADGQRGVLTQQRIARIKDAIEELVRDLADNADMEPPPAEEKETVAGPTLDQQHLPKRAPRATPRARGGKLRPEWRGEAPVLCIAGRGPLDEAAAQMLAQLLGKHGLGTRIVGYDAVSRVRLPALPVEGVAMACISYLDLSGSPSHLRYLLRRLRQRLPEAKILVGLWPAGDPILHDSARRAAIGADFTVTTLSEAVEACLDAACTP